MLTRLFNVTKVALENIIPEKKLENIIVNNKKEFENWQGVDSRYYFDKPEHDGIIYIREKVNVEEYASFTIDDPEDFYRAVWSIKKQTEVF
jgi:hypothetical protein